MLSWSPCWRRSRGWLLSVGLELIFVSRFSALSTASALVSSPLLWLTLPSRKVWPAWSRLARATAEAVDDGAAAAGREADQEAAAAEVAEEWKMADSSTISKPSLWPDLSALVAAARTGTSFYIARTVCSLADELHRIASPLSRSPFPSHRIASHHSQSCQLLQVANRKTHIEV